MSLSPCTTRTKRGTTVVNARLARSTAQRPYVQRCVFFDSPRACGRACKDEIAARMRVYIAFRGETVLRQRFVAAGVFFISRGHFMSFLRLREGGAPQPLAELDARSSPPCFGASKNRSISPRAVWFDVWVCGGRAPPSPAPHRSSLTISWLANARWSLAPRTPHPLRPPLPSSYPRASRAAQARSRCSRGTAPRASR